MTILRATVKGVCGPESIPWANVLHFIHDGAPINDLVVPDVRDAILATYLNGTADLGIANILAAEGRLRQILMQAPTPGSEVVEAFNGDAAFAGTGGTMPTHSSVVVSLRTALYGRRGRGRIFLPPLRAPALEAGKVAAASRIAIEAAFKNLETVSDLAQLAVYSRVDNVARPVTNIRVGDRFDVLQRRKYRGGETYTDVTTP